MAGMENAAVFVWVHRIAFNQSLNHHLMQDRIFTPGDSCFFHYYDKIDKKQLLMERRKRKRRKGLFLLNICGIPQMFPSEI